MIKIIRGVYGYVNENGTVEPKTNKDAPFSLKHDEEARLVNQGVAEYVDEPKQVKSEQKPEPKSEAKKPAKKNTKKTNKKATKTDDAPPVLEAVDPE